MSLFLDILDVNYDGLSRGFAEGELHSFSVGHKLHLGDCVGHQVPDGPAVIKTEENLTESVSWSKRGDNIKHPDSKKSYGVFDGGLFHFPRNEFSLLSSSIENDGGCSRELNWSNWCIEFILDHSLVPSSSREITSLSCAQEHGFS